MKTFAAPPPLAVGNSKTPSRLPTEEELLAKIAHLRNGLLNMDFVKSIMDKPWLGGQTRPKKGNPSAPAGAGTEASGTAAGNRPVTEGEASGTAAGASDRTGASARAGEAPPLERTRSPPPPQDHADAYAELESLAAEALKGLRVNSEIVGGTGAEAQKPGQPKKGKTVKFAEGGTTNCVGGTAARGEGKRKKKPVAYEDLGWL